MKNSGKDNNTKSSKNMLSSYNMTFTEMKMGKKYPDTNILIDIGLICSVFKNPSILLNIKLSKNIMRTLNNGVYKDSRFRGTFPKFFWVWYNDKPLMNILTMSNITNKVSVTINIDVEDRINVHMEDGSILKFNKVWLGLYIL